MASLFITSYFKACLYRRWIVVKRSWGMVTFSIFSVLASSALAIVCFYLMKSLMKSTSTLVDFNVLTNKNEYICYEINESKGDDFKKIAQEYVSIFIGMFRNDTGREPVALNFGSRDELNEWFYGHSQDKTGPEFVSMGIGFRDFYDLNAIRNEVNHTDEIIVYWNSSETNADGVANTLISPLQWKRIFGVDKSFGFSTVTLLERLMNVIFGYMAPMLVADEVITIVPLLISQPIEDIAGEVRPSMISCTLSLLSYLAVSFVVDFIIWVIAVTVVWFIFLMCQM
jgi:hypothetical protein